MFIIYDHWVSIKPNSVFKDLKWSFGLQRDKLLGFSSDKVVDTYYLFPFYVFICKK